MSLDEHLAACTREAAGVIRARTAHAAFRAGVQSDPALRRDSEQRLIELRGVADKCFIARCGIAAIEEAIR
jgi:hypothetical protein